MEKYSIDPTIILAGLIYVLAYYYRKSQGISLETVFTVIAPMQ